MPTLSQALTQANQYGGDHVLARALQGLIDRGQVDATEVQALLTIAFGAGIDPTLTGLAGGIIAGALQTIPPAHLAEAFLGALRHPPTGLVVSDPHDLWAGPHLARSIGRRVATDQGAATTLAQALHRTLLRPTDPDDFTPKRRNGVPYCLVETLDALERLEARTLARALIRYEKTAMDFEESLRFLAVLSTRQCVGADAQCRKALERRSADDPSYVPAVINAFRGDHTTARRLLDRVQGTGKPRSGNMPAFLAALTRVAQWPIPPYTALELGRLCQSRNAQIRLAAIGMLSNVSPDVATSAQARRRKG